MVLLSCNKFCSLPVQRVVVIWSLQEPLELSCAVLKLTKVGNRFRRKMKIANPSNNPTLEIPPVDSQLPLFLYNQTIHTDRHCPIWYETRTRRLRKRTKKHLSRITEPRKRASHAFSRDEGQGTCNIFPNKVCCFETGSDRATGDVNEEGNMGSMRLFC
jgi:hypothetical protein